MCIDRRIYIEYILNIKMAVYRTPVDPEISMHKPNAIRLNPTELNQRVPAEEEPNSLEFGHTRSCSERQKTMTTTVRQHWTASCLFCFRAWDSRDSRRVLVATRDSCSSDCYGDADWPRWRIHRRVRPIGAAVSAWRSENVATAVDSV